MLIFTPVSTVYGYFVKRSFLTTDKRERLICRLKCKKYGNFGVLPIYLWCYIFCNNLLIFLNIFFSFKLKCYYLREVKPIVLRSLSSGCVSCLSLPFLLMSPQELFRTKRAPYRGFFLLLSYFLCDFVHLIDVASIEFAILPVFRNLFEASFGEGATASGTFFFVGQ